MKAYRLPSRLHQAITGLLMVLMAVPLNGPFVLFAQTAGPIVVVNGGNRSRSVVTNLSVTLPTNRVLAPAGFQVRPLPGAGAVATSNVLLSVDALANRYDLTFPGLPAGSLPDGNYHASVVSTPATSAAGPRESASLPLHRYFGDNDGDRDVDFFDTWFFRETWGEDASSSRFDARFDDDGNGMVATNDLAHFNANYFTILAPQPAIFAHLVYDDGRDAGDGVVTSATNLVIAGAVALTNTAIRFEAALSAPTLAPVAFTDVTVALTPHATFLLDPNRLAEIHGSALTNGPYDLQLRLVETNDTVSAAFTLPFALGEETNCFFRDLAGWSNNIATNLPPGGVLGSVVADNCDAVLTEGDSFTVTLEKTLTVPSTLSPQTVLATTYSTPTFDGAATNRMRDAFEVALVDANGRPLTYTITGTSAVVPASVANPPPLPVNPDVCFNHSDSLAPFAAPGVALTSSATGKWRLAIDVSHLAPRSTARLIFRLVNNDRDRATTVRISEVGFAPAPADVPLAGSRGPAFSQPAGLTAGLRQITDRGGKDSAKMPRMVGSSGMRLLSAASTTPASPSSTADVPLIEGTVTGVFGNPLPVTATYTGIGSNYFTWGYSDTPVCSLKFSGGAFSVHSDAFFELGALEYFNGSVFGGSVDSVEIWLTITVTNSYGEERATFKYPLKVISTTNGSDPWASADYVILAAELPENSFTLAGKDYRLQLVFGQSDTNGFTAITQFHVLEEASASAQVVGRLTERRTLQPAPPFLAVEYPDNQQTLASGETSLSGYAIADRPELFPDVYATNRVTRVSVNGQAVEALDAAGNFFGSVQVLPGRNVFEVAATDVFNQTTKRSITVYGQTDFAELSRLDVVSASIQPDYGRTTFNEWTSVLYADLAIRNVGSHAVQSPLYVGITRLSDPTVSVLGADGTTTDGIPYYDFSPAVTNASLATGQASLSRTIALHNPNHVQFSYDLVALGQLNQAPQFTSIPVLEAIVGKPYVYNATAADPDLDPVTLLRVVGPTNLILTAGAANPGEGRAALTWTPVAADVGTHDVQIRAEDGRGGVAEQRYLLSVIDPPGNRPPYFTSIPVTLARVGTPYTYNADAADPDGDTVAYSIGSAPATLSLDSTNGGVTWTPTPDQLGTHNVTLRVDDGRGGANSQSYMLRVLPMQGNRAPAIVSQPVSGFVPGAEYKYAVEAIDPDGDVLNYSIRGPAGMTIDSQTGSIVWQPSPDLVVTNAIVFSDDGSFDASVWQTEFYTSGSGGVIHETQHASGGSPDAFLEIEHVIHNAEFGTDLPGAIAFLWNRSAMYSPRVDGAVYSIDYREDRLLIQAPGTSNVGQNGGVAIRQAGNMYVHMYSPGFAAQWQKNLSEGLRAQDFALFRLDGTDPSWVFTDDSKHPDFSRQGETIQFGFVMSEWTWHGLSGITKSSGIDNWSVVIRPSPEYSVEVRVTDPKGGQATQAFDVLAQSPANITGFVYNDDDGDGTWSPGAQFWVDGRSRYILRSRALAEVLPSDRYAGGAWDAGGFCYTVIHGELRKFDQKTGALVEVLATNLPGWYANFAVTDDGRLFGTDQAYDAVREFRVKGAFESRILARGGWLDGVSGIVVSDPQTLFVCAGEARAVYELNSLTGDRLASYGMPYPLGLSLGEDGLLYVGNWLDGIARLDPVSGAVTWFDPSNQAKRLYTINCALGPDGHLYAPEFYQKRIVRYDLSSQEFVDVYLQGDVRFTPGIVQMTEHRVSSVTGREEDSLARRLVYLDANRNNRRDPDETFAVTDGNGQYFLTNLNVATYVVRAEGQSGWRPTAPSLQHYLVPSKSGETTYNVDFGFQQGTNGAANYPPAFYTSPPSNGSVNVALVYVPGAIDPDGDLPRFDLVSAPAGMAISSESQVVVWIPDNDQVGVHSVILRASDGRGGVALQSWEITVAAPNTPPVIASMPPGPAVVDLPYRYALRAQDAENQPLTFSLGTNAPAGMTLTNLPAADEASPSPLGGGSGGVRGAVLLWTPQLTDIGTNRIAVLVRDNAGGAARQEFDLEVVPSAPNRAPVFLTQPRTQSGAAAPYQYLARAYDADGDPLTFQLTTAPAGMTIHSPLSTLHSALLAWTPTSAQIGAHSIELTVDDGRPGGVVTQAFSVVVTSTLTNAAPVIVSTPPTQATLDQLYSYNLAAEDPDDDAITWHLAVAPRGMSIDPMLGTVRWTPDVDQLGTNSVMITAADPFLATNSQTFDIVVNAVNRPPQIRSVPPVAAQTGEPYLYAPRASDPDGDPVTWAFEGPVPDGMTIDAITGLVRWLPAKAQTGVHVIRIRVDDGQGGSDLQQYNLNAADQKANHPPLIASSPAMFAGVGRPYAYTVKATDIDGDALTVQLLAQPSGAVLEPVSSAPGQAEAIVRWTPTAEHTGSQEFILSARDTVGASAGQRFSVRVRPNQAPVITSGPRTNAAPDLVYRYDVAASDAEGDALTYRLLQSPDGMAINTYGQVTWTPTTNQLGSHPLKIEVADSFGAVATQSFALIVAMDTEPPVVALDLVRGQVVKASGAWTAPLGSTAGFRVRAADNIGVASLSLRVGVDEVPLNTQGLGSLEVTNAGIFPVVATATDLVGNTASRTNTIWFRDPRAQSQISVTIHSPTNDTSATKPIPVVATITNRSDLLWYRVDYARAAEVDPANIGAEGQQFTTLTNVTLPSGTREIQQATLAWFDPTILLNDSYVIRVVASDGFVNWYEPVIVSVVGNLKFGELRLEFTDLAIPLAGIPIQIRRVYDSRESKRPGDFGYGWNLGVQNARIRKTLRPSSVGPTMVPGSKVYLNTPDGRRVGFTVTKSFVSGFGVEGAAITAVGIRMEPDAGVFDKLQPESAMAWYDDERVFKTGLWDMPYSPSTFILTTKDGTRYRYDESAGLQTVMDANGSKLVFTRDGIFHYTAESDQPDQSIPFVRDPLGRIVQITDPNGQALRYTYDAAGDLRSYSDQVTNVTRYAYSIARAHYLTNIVDPLGRNALQAEYDSTGRLVAIRDALGNPIEQDFNLDANTVTLKDANGHTNIVRYDDRGNEVMKAVPGISTNYFEFDASNNEIWRQDARGFVTARAYDSRGNLTNIVDAVSNVTAVAYNDLNKPTRVTDALGRSTYFGYDSQGNLTNVVNALGGEAAFYRDALGRVFVSRDFNGNTLWYKYSGGCACGKPGKVINPEGTFRLFEYNSSGQTTREVNELGHETLSCYDDAGRLLWVRDAMSNVTSYAYAAGLKVSETDPLGRTTWFGYDDANRLVAQTNAMGGVVRFEYDEGTNRTAVIDPVGNVTRFYYDAANRLTQQVDPWGHTNLFAYDPAGNRIEAIDRNGRKRTFEYDGLNRRTKEHWWDGTNIIRTIEFGFNALGVMTNAYDPEVSRLTFEFDPLNRLQRTTQSGVTNLADFTLTYAYDGMTNVISVTDNWGVQVASRYDARNQLTNRVWRGGEIPGASLNFAYDAAGNRTNIHRIADVAGTQLVGQSQYAYNAVGAMTDILHANGAGDALAEYHYARDPAQQIVQCLLNGQTTLYDYDLTGQLTNAVYAPPTQPNESYLYDANGNRIGGGYVVTTNNQIIADGAYTYGYDAAGSLVARTNGATGATTAYTFDHRNRLVSVVDKNVAGVATQRVEFTYDARNRRIAKTVNGEIQRFLLNGEDIWADADATALITARYLLGNRIDEMLASWWSTLGVNWYLTDNLGTVRALVDSSGTVVNQLDVSGFGTLIPLSALGRNDRFAFTGREWDEDTGLLFYRARFYSATLGRYVSEDPIGFAGGDYNLFRYAANNPVSNTDPSGKIVLLSYLGTLVGRNPALPCSVVGMGTYGLDYARMLRAAFDIVRFAFEGRFEEIEPGAAILHASIQRLVADAVYGAVFSGLPFGACVSLFF